MPDNATFEWNGKRATIRLGDEMVIRGARTAVCADGQWLFPFEHQSKLSEWEEWSDPIGPGRHRRLSAGGPGQPFAAELHIVIYDKSSLCRLWASLTNRSGQPLGLSALHLLEVAEVDGGSLGWGYAPDETVLFTDSGHGCWAGVSRLLGPAYFCDEIWTHFCPPDSGARMLALTGNRKLGPGDHSAPGGLAVFSRHSPTDAPSLLMGIAPVQRALGSIICRSREGQGVEFLAVLCGLFGYSLPVGETYVSEDLLLGRFPSGLAALAEYATVSARLRDVRIRCETLPSGWMSWYGYRLKADEESILANARIVADRFLPYGMDIIQPDYCWQHDFVPNEWRETNERFPHGLAWLADQIKRMGLRMGFWAAPVSVSSASRLFHEHPEYLLKDERGQPLFAGKWTWGHKETMHVIDPTVPGAMDDACEQITHLRRITSARYWKLDFVMQLLFLSQRPKFADVSLIPGVETYRLALKKLREAAGDDFIYFCSNFGSAEWNIGDTTTTAPDIGNPCFSEPNHADERVYGLDSFRQNATTIIARHFLHRRLTLLNADAANVGPDGDLTEAQVRFSLVAFSGGQFFLGEDLTRYPEERLALVEKGLPAYGTAAIPVDLFASPFPDHPRLWRLPVTTAWDNWDVLCLVNLTEQPRKSVDLMAVLQGRGTDWVFDFWTERLLGRLEDYSQFDLAPLESKILCIRSRKERPHLLSTNMHVTQGGVEVLEHAWDESASELRLTFSRRPGAQGKAWVTVPAGMTLGECRSEGTVLQVQRVSAELVECAIEFHRKDVSITLHFRMDSKGRPKCSSTL